MANGKQNGNVHRISLIHFDLIVVLPFKLESSAVPANAQFDAPDGQAN